MTFKLQVWESSSYLGRSQLIYTPGGYQPAFLIKSYHWAPGAYESKIKCSVATCLNGGENGWWGSSERYWPGDFQNTSRGLLFVNIECGPAFESPACPGPADQTTYSSVPVLETTSLDPSRTIVDGEVVTPTSSSTTGSGSRSGTGALTTGGRAQSTLGSSTLTPTPTPTGK
ncbi:hypothetical protein K458DRAFT_160385 [Lentithecium fluviatile CBS 122367]|uniref:Uncharacterized protein n=1 Tax=Lentithecium fluviatile CBS 122367 TaxID=1168545 RepID=A0A6G1IHJ8_9PLEO|nr:hypothetical protein K458DRAFT_160385 [Lentithecium fluviatile CBS 122367]